MIAIENLVLKYGSRTILDIDSLTLPNKGLVCITGPSGCGKTTLLNVISGFNKNYSGKVLVNNHNIAELSSQNLDEFHTKDMGILFQDFLLIDELNVMENILLPTNILSALSKGQKKKRVREVLKLVNLQFYEKRKVKNLSGGEKQRIALARALVNNPPILLCDEPTGSLDDNNKNIIMKTLKELSKNKLVLVVSHDIELMKKYSNQIINLKYGKISGLETLNTEEKDKNHKRQLSFYKQKRRNLGFNDFYHLSSKISFSKKLREVISIGSISLGLIGVGIGSLLLSNIKSQLIATFQDIYPNNALIIENKNSDISRFNIKAANKEMSTLFCNANNYALDNLGVFYQTNVDEFFEDENNVQVTIADLSRTINSLSLNSFNEILSLNEINIDTVYPKPTRKLHNDEVILNLAGKDYRELHQFLNVSLEREPVSLGNKIMELGVELVVNVRNDSWGYVDSEIFKIVGARYGSYTGIIHSNLSLNEYLFEEVMQLKAKYNFLSKDEYPWTLKKSHFLLLKNTDEFLTKNIFNKYFLFNIPYSYEYVNLPEEYANNRAIFYERPQNYPLFDNEVNKMSKEFKNIPYNYTSSKSYITFGNSVINGFLNPIYFANTEETLSEIISVDKSRSEDVFEEIDLLRKGTAATSLAYKKKDGVRFIPFTNENNDFNNLKYDEIVISSGLAKKIIGKEDIQNESIYLGTEKNRYKALDGRIIRSYSERKLKIRAVINNETPAFYHTSIWPLVYFQNYVGLGPFAVVPEGVIFNFSKDVTFTQEELFALNKANPEYAFYSPGSDLIISVNETTNQFTSIIFIISTLAILVSLITVILVVYLTIIDNKKTIFLLRIIGYSHKEVQELFTINGLIIGIKAVIVTLFSLILINIVTTSVLQNMFNTSIFTFSILPYLIVTLLGITLSLCAGFIASRTIKNESPLNLLKEEL